jgi:hypothetical protein
MGGADEQVGAGLGLRRSRQEDDGTTALPGIEHPRIAGNADHRKGRVGRVRLVPTFHTGGRAPGDEREWNVKTLPQRVPARPQFPCCRFADHRHPVGRGFIPVEEASLDQRELERAQVAGRYGKLQDLHRAHPCRSGVVNGDPRRRRTKRESGSFTDRRHLRQLPDSLPHLPPRSVDLAGSKRARHHDLQREQSGEVKAGVVKLRPHGAMHQQPGNEDQRGTQRELRDHEIVPSPRESDAATERGSFAVERRQEVAAGHVQRGQEPSRQTRQHRYGRRKGEYAVVRREDQPCGAIASMGLHVEQPGPHESKHGCSQGPSQGSSEEPEHDTLGDEQRQETAAGGSERAPHREFKLTRHRSRQDQIGGIRAGDDKDGTEHADQR